MGLSTPANFKSNLKLTLRYQGLRDLGDLTRFRGCGHDAKAKPRQGSHKFGFTRVERPGLSILPRVWPGRTTLAICAIMGHGPLNFKESAVRRAVKAVIAAGQPVAGVRFDRDGGFTIVIGKPGDARAGVAGEGAATSGGEWDNIQ